MSSKTVRNRFVSLPLLKDRGYYAGLTWQSVCHTSFARLNFNPSSSISYYWNVLFYPDDVTHDAPFNRPSPGYDYFVNLCSDSVLKVKIFNSATMESGRYLPFFFRFIVYIGDTSNAGVEKRVLLYRTFSLSVVNPVEYVLPTFDEVNIGPGESLYCRVFLVKYGEFSYDTLDSVDRFVMDFNLNYFVFVPKVSV